MAERTIRAKWTMDGAKTLSEAAQMLKDYAEWLLEQEGKGWQLAYEIEDDYGTIVKGRRAKPKGGVTIEAYTTPWKNRVVAAGSNDLAVKVEGLIDRIDHLEYQEVHALNERLTEVETIGQAKDKL